MLKGLILKKVLLIYKSCIPDSEAREGRKVKASAEEERIIAHSISRRWISHSFVEKL